MSEGFRRPFLGFRKSRPIAAATVPRREGRIERWVASRIRREPGPVTVGRKRVYIVPTRFGYGFAVTATAMLLGAMNYSNSMAFALAFLLAGLGLVAMHHTHANLVNVQVRPGRAQPVFAGDVAHFEVLVDNPAAAPRYSLALSWPRQPPVATVDVATASAASMSLPLQAPQRGWLSAGRFALSTEFPLGLFHAWTWIELDQRCLVFPMPAASGGQPPPTSGAGVHGNSQQSGQDEFAGLRGYQRGDTLRAIHWKSLPKAQTLLVKQFNEALDDELWLDWKSLPQRHTEDRLSQLTRWLLDADAEGLACGLRLPGVSIAPGRGEAHRYECLKALALFPA